MQAPVYGVNLTTGAVLERSPNKTDLFTASKGTLSYLQLISLLQAKLGEHAIKQISLKDDFRPDVINLYHSPSSDLGKIKTQLQAMRPSFLFTNPLPLSEKVSVIHGPERISTGWWDNNTVVRDYFVAQNQHGQWLWIYRTPNTSWYVHGLFG